MTETTAATMSVYLDHNATSPVHPEVTQALISVLGDTYGNPSAPYAIGVEAKRVLARARANVGALLGVRRKQVFFTSGGTEANNLALTGVFFARRNMVRPHLILSAIEHPSVAATCQWLADRHGAEVTVIGVPSTGVVDPADVVNALRPETVLVTVMHANNETGAVQPVEIIGQFLEGVGVHFHVDGVQAAGRIPVDFEAIACDSYSVSAHKFGGLKGCGALVLRGGSQVDAILQGGHQEKGLRAGTENVPGIAAMGKAAEIASRDLQKSRAHCLRMRAVFDALAVRLPDCSINGDKSLRLPNTTNLRCRDADAMSVVMALSSQGVFVGTGSACASDTQEPSRVLKAMGLTDRDAFCSIRISTGPENTLLGATSAARKIEEVVERTRLLSEPDSIGACDESCPCHQEVTP